MPTFTDKAAIELRHLAIGYRQGGSESIVAEALSARFESGTLTCLLGNNGIGKSTLLRTIAGLQPPLGGAVAIESRARVRTVAEMSRHETALTVGIVLTDRPYAVNLTVGELVSMGRVPYTGILGRLRESDHEAIRRAMATTGVADFAHKSVRNISDGMLQKAMIAKALAQQTPIILLDEPTAYLDFQAKVGMMRLLLSLAHDEGRTILMSTHDVQLALKLSDTIAVMTGDGITVAAPRQMATSAPLLKLVESAGASLNSSNMTIEFG